LPQPDGPTNATNSPWPIRKLVVASAGTARSPRPNVTETSDNSIATGTPGLPAGDGTGLPDNTGVGCMRIIRRSACKRDASEIGLFRQENPAEPHARAASICAVGAQKCMQLRR
jgi:hypothetical protein